jgi:hypothetical protein
VLVGEELLAELSLYPRPEGRSSPINLADGYRPHLRISDGAHLGVELHSDDGGELGPGETAVVRVRLRYDVDYSDLVPGGRFSVVEGLNQVGTGVILAAVRSP